MVFFSLRCKRWLILTKRKDLDDVFRKEGAIKLNKNYYICSDHFQSEDYVNSRNKSQGLKKGVVPSLNLPLEKKKQSRPYPKKRTLEPEICELAKDLNDLPAKKHKVTETLIRNVPTTHLEQDMINDENILDTTRFQTEIQYLKQKVKNCQKTISRQKFQILQLKKENRKLKERNSVNIKTGEFMKSQQLL